MEASDCSVAALVASRRGALNRGPSPRASGTPPTSTASTDRRTARRVADLRPQPAAYVTLWPAAGPFPVFFVAVTKVWQNAYNDRAYCRWRTP